MIAKAVTIKSENVRARLFWALLASFMMLLCFYTYFTVSAIIDVAERRRIEGEVMDLRTDTVSLELAFISRENSITLEHARELGFVETTRQFASRGTPVTAVSINEPR